MNRALGRTAAQKTSSELLSEPTDIGHILKNALEDVTKAYGVSKTAEVIRDILFPRNEQQNPLESLKGLKEIGLDFGTMASSYKDATGIWQTMFAESRKDAESARKEAAEATNNLIALAIASMTSEQRRQMEELARRIEDKKEEKNQNQGVFSRSIEEAVARIVTESLAKAFSGEKQQQPTPPEEAILRQLETFDRLANWFRKREEDIRGIAPGYRSDGLLNPEVMRLTLEDERARLQMKLEEERYRQELEMKQRSMATVESIAEKLAPHLGTIISSLMTKGNGATGPKVEPAAEAASRPSLREMIKTARAGTPVHEL